ncbi:MAG: hypothetical protein ABIN94_17360 [Ferruginibacter sp.]
MFITQVLSSVTTTFQGDEADGARSNMNNQSIREIMTGFQKFYATYF